MARRLSADQEDTANFSIAFEDQRIPRIGDTVLYMIPTTIDNYNTLIHKVLGARVVRVENACANSRCTLLVVDDLNIFGPELLKLLPFVSQGKSAHGGWMWADDADAEE